jgi:hypothetical protein
MEDHAKAYETVKRSTRQFRFGNIRLTDEQHCGLPRGDRVVVHVLRGANCDPDKHEEHAEGGDEEDTSTTKTFGIESSGNTGYPVADGQAEVYAELGRLVGYADGCKDLQHELANTAWRTFWNLTWFR